MIELKPNFYEEEVLDDLHPKMRSLSISQQAMVEDRVRSLANQIMTQLQQMLLTGTSAPIIKMSAVTLFSQLKANAERMLDDNKHHEQSRVEDAKYFEEFAQRVQGLTIDALTPPKKPQSRAFDSVVESVRNTQKANIQEHIAVARGLAAGIEFVSNVVVDGVCNANPINRFACDMAAEGFQSVSNCFDYEPTVLPQVLESQYGIPQKVGKQFARDGITVGAAVLPFPPVARFAKFLPGLNAVRIPSSLGRNVVHFLKDESGFIRMPKEFIKLFEENGYKVVPGGKGSHTKMVRPNSPLVTIPLKELPIGTAKFLLKLYEETKPVDLLPSKSILKVVPGHSHQKPFPHRTDYSGEFLRAKTELTKEFDGLFNRELILVQYHNGSLNPSWIPSIQANHLLSIPEISGIAATEVSVARLPAGEPIRFLYDRSGGAVRYQFFDFDPKWILETRTLPVTTTSLSYRQFSKTGKPMANLSSKEIPSHSDVYFHTTGSEEAMGILLSEEIFRKDKPGNYRGAFVSTRPENLKGNVAFAFNRKIEFVSPVISGHIYSGAYCAGFAKSIPVNRETLEYIAVGADALGTKTLQQFQQEISTAAGREIKVVPLEATIKKIKRRTAEEGMTIPNQWTLEIGEEVPIIKGVPIFK
jgi:predicted RNA binding protein YcfA (HicA-like mRNA interferase family)